MWRLRAWSIPVAEQRIALSSRYSCLAARKMLSVHIYYLPLLFHAPVLSLSGVSVATMIHIAAPRIALARELVQITTSFIVHSVWTYHSNYHTRKRNQHFSVAGAAGAVRPHLWRRQSGTILHPIAVSRSEYMLNVVYLSAEMLGAVGATVGRSAN
jgi:hypothetical protein